jgi:hypothetical protein
VEAAGIEPASEDLQPWTSTCVVQDLQFALEDPLGQGSSRASLLLFRVIPRSHGESAILLSVASSTPTGEGRGNASLTRLERTRNRWRVYLFSVGLTSHRSARHAAQTSTVPVETRFPKSGTLFDMLELALDLRVVLVV